MYPKGPIWQTFRTRAFDSIPLGTCYSYKKPISLNQWRSQGFYKGSMVTNKGFELDVNNLDFAAALLAESEYLLDHAAEQSAFLHLYLSSVKRCSDAWALVTLYYWTFFNAVAFSRLQGSGVWFLDKDAASELALICSAPFSTSLGAGTYEISLGVPTSTDSRLLRITKTKARRLHDQLWNSFFAENDSILKSEGNEQANQFEYRIQNIICIAGKRFGNTWPSDIRNAVNYRPGIGYRAVRGLDP
jgi:hypothetical protein